MSASQSQPENLHPKFFTKSQWQKLLSNSSHDNLMQHRPVVKLFTPDCGSTWLLVSVSKSDPDLAFGLCDLGVGFPELGYVSLKELSQIRGRLNLPVERDRYIDLNKSLKTYTDLAEINRRIVT